MAAQAPLESSHDPPLPLRRAETATRLLLPLVRGPVSVVCLCGSTRFRSAFDLANMDETLRGNVVISVGLFGHADYPDGARVLTSDGDESTAAKQDLDALHLRKIDLADEVLVINVGGYVGSSTKREIAYAREHGKTVRFLFPSHPRPSA